MPPARPFRLLALLTLIALAAAAAYVLAALAGWLGTLPGSDGERPLPTRVNLAGLDSSGRPFSAYAAVDPALVPALEAASGLTAPDPLAVIVPNVPPVGIYLPATGNTQFELPTPIPTATSALLPPPKPTWTPTPTLTPTATATPVDTLVPSETPIPVPPTFTPFLAPTLEGPPGYGGADCAPSGWPVGGLLTQRYYWYHKGIDLGTPHNSGVVATHSAEVVFAGWRTDGYGNLIILQNGPFITYYGHLNGFNVSVGQKVARGTVIGLSGSTGNSSGPHVHYEIRINDIEVDPTTFEARGYPSC